MSKIWVLHTKYKGRQYFKTEASFLEEIDTTNANSKVQILQVIEEHDNAGMYKKALLAQRDRDDQLEIVLENNKEKQILLTIKEKLTKQNHPKANAILYKLQCRELSFATFKSILTHYGVRDYLLYTGENSVEWYKLLFQVQKFKIAENFGNQPLSQDRLQNISRAKFELIMEKRKQKK